MRTHAKWFIEGCAPPGDMLGEHYRAGCDLRESTTESGLSLILQGSSEMWVIPQHYPAFCPGSWIFVFPQGPFAKEWKSQALSTLWGWTVDRVAPAAWGQASEEDPQVLGLGSKCKLKPQGGPMKGVWGDLVSILNMFVTVQLPSTGSLCVLKGLL